MTRVEQRKRRALIVRRWNAYRVSVAQRELWRQRREQQLNAFDEDDVESGGSHALLTDLPDDLVG